MVQPASQNSDVTFSKALPEKISEVPGVESTTSLASTYLRDGKDVSVVFGVDENYPDIFRLNYAAGGPDAFSKLENGGALIGKQLAETRKLGVGDAVELPTPDGPKKAWWRVSWRTTSSVAGRVSTSLERRSPATSTRIRASSSP